MNLEQVLDMLIAGVDEEEEVHPRNDPDKVASMVHFPFGMETRNSWSLWQDTPLTRWFRSIGISHADDMSAIITISFCRKVRRGRHSLDDQVKHYQEYWTREIGRPIP